VQRVEHLRGLLRRANKFMKEAEVMNQLRAQIEEAL
jgi:hypothetical protein